MKRKLGEEGVKIREGGGAVVRAYMGMAETARARGSRRIDRCSERRIWSFGRIPELCAKERARDLILPGAHRGC